MAQQGSRLSRLFRRLRRRITERRTSDSALNGAMLFRKLERRRVLSADLLFNAGTLTIDFSTFDGFDHVEITANGGNFDVEVLNDFGNSTGPIQISDLQRVIVTTQFAGYGQLSWTGNFNSANLVEVTIGNGNAIDSAWLGLDSNEIVDPNFQFTLNGPLGINAQNSVEFAGNITVNNDIDMLANTIQMGGNLTGFTVDIIHANGWSMLQGATLQGTNGITQNSIGPGVNELAGNIVTLGGTAQFDSAITLTDDLSISTNNGFLVFNSTVDSDAADFFNPNSLTITAGGGSVIFNGAVGASANGELDALQINSAHDVNLSTLEAQSFSQLAGTGTTQFSNGVTLGGNFQFTGFNLTFGGTADIDGFAAINSNGTFTLNGPLLADGGVTQAFGVTHLNNDIQTVGNNVLFQGTVVLGADVFIDTGAGGGNITFTGLVNSADGALNDLNLNAGLGNVSLDNLGTTVGGSLGTFSVSSANSINATNNVNAFSIDLNAGNGGIGSAPNAFTFNSAFIAASTTGNANIFLNTLSNSFIGIGGIDAGSGTLTIHGQGLQLSTGNDIGNNTTVAVDSNATLDTAGLTETIGRLQLINGTVSGNGTLIASSDYDLRSGTIGAVLAGTVGLTKSTTGVVTLNSNSTYSGATTISGGELRVNGGIASINNVNVNAGTLAGTGTIGGNVVVASGATVAPGVNGPGQLTANGIQYTAGAQYAINLAGNTVGSQYDQFVSQNDVTLNNAHLLVNLGFTPAANDQFTIINNTTVNPINGTFLSLAQGTTFSSGLSTFQIDYFGGDGNDVVLTAIDLAAPTLNGTAGNDTFLVRALGGNTDVFLNGNLIYSQPTGSITGGLTINGLGGDDTLTVDFLNTTLAVPTGGITFDGGTNNAGGDAMILMNVPIAFTTHTYNFLNASDGDIVLNNGANHTINYVNLEPISNDGTANEIIFNLPNLANPDVVLQNSVNAGEMDLTGSTFEDVTFVNPAVSLTINGGTLDDVITVASVDAAYRASLIINAGTGTDQIHFDSDVTLGSATSAGNLTLTAESIFISASNIRLDGNADSGTLTLNGTVELEADLFIDTNDAGTDGNVQINGAIHSQTAGNFALTVDSGAGNVNFTSTVGAGANQQLGAVIVNSQGTTTFSDAVTAASLNTDAGGTTNIGGDVTTTGAQSYGDDVRLTNNVQLNTTDTNITFGATLNSDATTRNLTMGVGAGDILLTGLAGNTAKLGQVQINTVRNLTTNGVRAVAFRQGGGTGTTTVNVGVFSVPEREGITADNEVSLNNSNVQINGPIRAAHVATDGAISITAANNVVQASEGNLQVANGTDAANNSIYVRAVAGSITMADGLSSTTSGGNIRYHAGTDVTVGLLNAGAGGVSVVAGNDILDARADTITVGADGFSSASGLARTENILAATARLEAGRNIGTPQNGLNDGNPLDIDVNNLAVASNTGSIYLQEANSVTLAQIAALQVSEIAVGGGVTLVADGAALGGAHAQNGHFKIETLTGSLTVDAGAVAGQVGGVNHAVIANGDVLLSAGTTGSDPTRNVVINGAVASLNGGITVLARNNVTQGATGDLQVVTIADAVANSIYVRAVDGSITMDSDASATASGANIYYRADTANQDVTVGILNAGNANVAISAGRDILDAQNDTVTHSADGFATTVGTRVVNIAAAGASLTAGRSVGVAGNPLDTSVTDLAVTAGQNVYILETNDLNIGEVAAFNTRQAHLNSTAANVAVSALEGVLANTGHAKIETLAGALTVVATAVAGQVGGVDHAVIGGLDVVLAAGGASANPNFDVVINAPVASRDGSITVLARHDVIQGANGDLQIVNVANASNNSIYVRAVDGAITMDANASATAINANIHYRADSAIGDIAVGLIDTQSGQIAITAGRDVTDAQNDTVTEDPNGFSTSVGLRVVNVIANNATINAGGSIGIAGNPLDLSVNAVAASAGQNVFLYESDNLNIGEIAAFNVRQAYLDSTNGNIASTATEGVLATNGVANVETIAGGITVIGTAVAGQIAGVDHAVIAGSHVLLAAGSSGSSPLFNVTIDGAVASQNDSITVLARNNVIQGANGDLLVVTPTTAATDTIFVRAVDGSITMDADASATAQGSHVVYMASSAGQSITVGLLDAGVGKVLAFAGLDILDAQNDTVGHDADGFATNLNPRAVNVTASAAHLFANTGSIGQIGNPLDTDVSTVSAVAGNSVYLHESNDLVIGVVGTISWRQTFLTAATGDTNLGTISGMEASGGNVKVETLAGDLTVASNAVVGQVNGIDHAIIANQDVVLVAGGIGALDDYDVVINAPVASHNGSITLLARHDVIQGANGDLLVVNTPNPVDNGIFVRAVTGEIRMDADATSTALNANIFYIAASLNNDVTVGRLNAGTGNVAIFAGRDIIDAQNDTVGHDGEGFTTLVGTRTSNVTAANAKFVAAGSVGVAANPLDTTVATIAMEAGQSLYIVNDGDLTIGDVAGFDVRQTHLDSTHTDITVTGLSGALAGTGHIKVDAFAGALTVAATAAAGQIAGVNHAIIAGLDVVLVSGSSASNPAFNVNINAPVASQNGSITVLARNNVNQAANGDLQVVNVLNPVDNSIYVRAVEGDITMDAAASSTASGANIFYRADAAGQNVIVGLLDAGNGNVAITAGLDIADAQVDTVGHDADGYATVIGARTVNIVAANARLNAGGSIGASANPLDTTVTTLAAWADQHVYVLESDALNIGSVGAFLVRQAFVDSGHQDVTASAWAGVAADNGNAKIETLAGPLTVVANTVTGQINGVNHAVIAGIDVVLVAGSSGANPAYDININAPVASRNGSITVLARQSVTQGAGGDLLVANAVNAVDNTIYVRADDGSITMDADATATTLGGNIFYRADAPNADVTVGLLNAGNADVAITASRNIIDAQNDTVSHDADGFATNVGVRVVNIAAASATLSAGGSVGVAGNPLDSSITTVAASAGNNFYLLESNDLNIDSTAPFNVRQAYLDSGHGNVAAGNLSGILASTGNAKIESFAGGITVVSAAIAGQVAGVDHAIIAGADVVLVAGSSGPNAAYNVAINAPVASQNGSITVLARQSVTQSADGDLTIVNPVDPNTSTIYVRAVDGSITMDDGAVDSAVNANIALRADNGDITVGLLNAGTAAVSVQAGNDILDARGDTVNYSVVGGVEVPGATGAAREANIIAEAARLVAGRDIGQSNNPFDLDVTRLAMDAGRNAYLWETSDLWVQHVGPITVEQAHLDSTTVDRTAAQLSGWDVGTRDVNGNIVTVGDLAVIIGGERLNQFANSTDQANNALVSVTGNARFDFVNAVPTYRHIDLARGSSTASDPNAQHDQELADNRLDGTVTVTGVNGDLRLRNISTTGGLPLEQPAGTLPDQLRNLELWYTTQDIALQNWTLNVEQDMRLFAGVYGDDRTEIEAPRLDAFNQPIIRNISSVADHITVAGNMLLAASGDVTVNVGQNDTLSVVGLTELVSIGGGDLSIIPNSVNDSVALNGLSFYSENLRDLIQHGDVSVQVTTVANIATNPLEIRSGSLQFANYQFTSAQGPQVVNEGTRVLHQASGIVYQFTDSRDPLANPPIDLSNTDFANTPALWVAVDNIAGELSLQTIGRVTDAAGTSIFVYDNAVFTTLNNLVPHNTTLADDADNVLWVAGTTSFTGDQVTVGRIDGTAHVVFGNRLEGVQPGDLSAGNATGGIVNAQANRFELHETDHTVLGNLHRVNDAQANMNQLVISSWGEIRNLVNSDNGGQTWRVLAGDATLTAGTGILLNGQNNTDPNDLTNTVRIGVLRADVNDNINYAQIIDPNDPNSVLITNQVAVNTSVDVFNELDMVTEDEGIRSAADINGGDPAVSFNDLRDSFSYDNALGKDFALFIKNDGALVIDTVTAHGNGLNLYVETYDDNALAINGQVAYVQDADPTRLDTGGLVLIAGSDAGQFTFGPQGIVIARDFVILDPSMNFTAYNAGQGPAGLGVVTTEQVMAQELGDNPGQNQDVLLKVAVEYGSTKTLQTGFNELDPFGGQPGLVQETRFQSIIGYADGNFQRFPTGTTPIGEGDFNGAEPNGDVFTRATPFSSQFLFNFSAGELPTAIVMSRGEGVYLFAENGTLNLGQQANGILSAEAADVTGILVGAVSPTQPPVEQAPVLEAPIYDPPEPVAPPQSLFVEIHEFDEPRALFESVTQVEVFLLNTDSVDDGDFVLEEDEFERMIDKINAEKMIVPNEFLADPNAAADGAGETEDGAEESKTKEGLKKQLTDANGQPLTISLPPTPAEIEAIKQAVRDGDPAVFEPGAYGILFQDRFSGDQWKLGTIDNLFTKPTELPENDSATSPDSANLWNEQPLVPSDDSAMPQVVGVNAEFEADEAEDPARMEAAAAISSALWLLSRGRTQAPQGAVVEQQDYSRAARRSRRLKRSH